jgi:hypothetical protein
MTQAAARRDLRAGNFWRWRFPNAATLDVEPPLMVGKFFVARHLALPRRSASFPDCPTAIERSMRCQRKRLEN